MIYKVYSTNTRGEDDGQKEIQNIDAYLDEEWFLYECKQKKRFYPYAGIFAVGIALGLSDFIKNTFLEYELKMDNNTFLMLLIGGSFLLILTISLIKFSLIKSKKKNVLTKATRKKVRQEDKEYIIEKNKDSIDSQAVKLIGLLIILAIDVWGMIEFHLILFIIAYFLFLGLSFNTIIEILQLKLSHKILV